jgi:hypothetical protein
MDRLDSLLLKNELSIIYLSEEFLLITISDLKNFIASDLSMALPVSAMLLTILTTIASAKITLSGLKRVHT